MLNRLFTVLYGLGRELGGGGYLVYLTNLAKMDAWKIHQSEGQKRHTSPPLPHSENPKPPPRLPPAAPTSAYPFPGPPAPFLLPPPPSLVGVVRVLFGFARAEAGEEDDERAGEEEEHGGERGPHACGIVGVRAGAGGVGVVFDGLLRV